MNLLHLLLWTCFWPATALPTKTCFVLFWQRCASEIQKFRVGGSKSQSLNTQLRAKEKRRGCNFKVLDVQRLAALNPKVTMCNDWGMCIVLLPMGRAFSKWLRPLGVVDNILFPPLIAAYLRDFLLHGILDCKLIDRPNNAAPWFLIHENC